MKNHVLPPAEYVHRRNFRLYGETAMREIISYHSLPHDKSLFINIRVDVGRRNGDYYEYIR